MERDSEHTFKLFSSPNWTDYELLDSGAGAKLEKFGPYTFVRPEAQAFWTRALPQEQWDAADATFQAGGGEDTGRWQFKHKVEPRWQMHYGDVKVWAKPTPFRHLGVFPEQASQWDWAADLIKSAHRPIKVLNLFAYTGLASLMTAKAGASVTHIDASKPAITWAHDNQILSKLEDKPIRWIIEDAMKFAQREVRRGNHYDGIIIDPPKFGRGPNGEIWRIEESLPILLKTCRELLSDQPLFFILTCYAIRLSALSLQSVLEEVVSGLGGEMTIGEIVTIEKSAGRMLSNAIFSRWSTSS